jgi:hypothetical protein
VNKDKLWGRMAMVQNCLRTAEFDREEWLLIFGSNYPVDANDRQG